MPSEKALERAREMRAGAACEKKPCDDCERWYAFEIDDLIAKRDIEWATAIAEAVGPSSGEKAPLVPETVQDCLAPLLRPRHGKGG